VPELALVLWVAYFVPTLGIRVLLQRRRTGRSGFADTTRGGTAQSLAQLVETVAIGLGVAAPILALVGTVEPIEALDKSAVNLGGAVLFVLGLPGIVISQEAMGSSWRIGVDPEERTELVTRGPFALVRNPIFSFLVLVQAGTFLLVPSVVALAGLALQVISVEMQVRLVEEPYLLRTHADEYGDYARRVGRFVPGAGRLR
jgi:protein-S-isoprenylcysteine O-methyltransferase Ste14